MQKGKPVSVSEGTKVVKCRARARVSCPTVKIGRAAILAACVGMAVSAAMAQQRISRFSLPRESTRADTQQTGYVRPDFHERLRNLEASTFGLPEMTTVVFGAAISQANYVPREWGQGWGAYGQRLASHFGSSLTEGATNLALGEALRLDTKYYPCTCKGFWPRVKHALLSSATARVGEDGRRVFSPPAIAAPYAGAFATLAWYPARYNAKDAFRTGNYNLLDAVGMNMALELLHPVLKRFHIH